MRITLFYIYFSALCLSRVLVCSAQTQPWPVPADWAKKKSSSAATSASIEAGKKIYISTCSQCHGEKGKGNGLLALSLNPHPANHTSKVFQQQKDGEIFYKIITGRNAMPPFRTTLSENEIWNVVNFIRTLEVKTIPAPVSAKTPAQNTPKNKSAKDNLSASQIKSVTIVKDTAAKTPAMADPSANSKKDTLSFTKTMSASNADNTNIVSRDSISHTNISKSENNNNYAVALKIESPDSSALITAIPDSIPPVNKNESIKNEKRKFLLTGSAHTNIIVDGNKFNSAGFEVGFLPVLLWKPSKRLFFESHFHITIGSGLPQANTSTAGMAGMSLRHTGMTTATAASSASSAPAGASIMIAYANLVYFVNPYLNITSGMFLSPFGIYAERLHAEWINKLPDAPEGMGHTYQMIPETELGIQMRGGMPIRKLKINYALYMSNGPSLINDTSKNAGRLSYDNLIDNNTNKAIGGRLGLMPLPGNPSMEIGFYAQHARVGNDGTVHAGVDALLYGADFTLYHYFNRIKGAVDIKGQYSIVSVDKIYYKANPMLTLNVPAEDVNLGDSTYRFNNVSKLFFITAAYRPTASEKFLKNTEYIFRYDMINTPCAARWGTTADRYTVGLAYWLESRSAVKISYSIEKIQNTLKNNNLLMIQWVMGL